MNKAIEVLELQLDQLNEQLEQLLEEKADIETAIRLLSKDPRDKRN